MDNVDFEENNPLCKFYWKDIESTLRKFICSLCFNICENSTVCSEKHLFCYDCIYSHIQRKNHCPMNQSHKISLSDLTNLPVKDVEQSGLRIYCKNRDQGCYWRGFIKDIEVHLSTDCYFHSKKRDIDDDLSNQNYIFEAVEANPRKILYGGIEGKEAETNNFSDETAATSEFKVEKPEESIDNFIRMERKVEPLRIEHVRQEKPFLDPFEEMLGSRHPPQRGACSSLRRFEVTNYLRRSDFEVESSPQVVFDNIDFYVENYDPQVVELVVLVPKFKGEFEIDLQMYSKLKEGWIAFGLCEESFLFNGITQLERGNYEGIVFIDTNWRLKDGIRGEVFSVYQGESMKYRTKFKMIVRKSRKSCILEFTDKILEMEVKEKKDREYYPCLLFNTNKCKLHTLNIEII